MGTHPIFESDFDCLTVLISDIFYEQHVDRVVAFDAFKDISLDTNDKILQLIKKNPKLNAVIIQQSKDMGEKAINVKKTMKELIVVGELLDIADLGSDGFNVNVSV